MGSRCVGTSPWWAGAPPHQGPRRRGVKTLRVGGFPTWLGGQVTPPGRHPPPRLDLGAGRPPLGGNPRGCAPSSPPPIYSGGFGAAHRQEISPLVQPSPSYTSSPPRCLAKLCRITTGSTTTTPPCCCWSSSPTSPSPLLDQGVGDVTGMHVC